MNRRIMWRLSADVNGTLFEMNGEGVGNASLGTCELHLEASPKFPSGFEPGSCPLICSHPTSLFFSRPDGADFAALTNGSYEITGRDGIVTDASGTELLRLKVHSTVHVDNGVFVIENTMRGVSNLPAIERNLTPFDDYIVPAAGGATALVRFKMLTRDGQILDGVTVSPYKWSGERLAAPLVRRVEDIRVEWNGRRNVSAYYRTSLRPIHAVTEFLVPEFDGMKLALAGD